jgi:hypothetical protein
MENENCICIGELRYAYRFFVGISNEIRDHLDELGVPGKIVFKWVVNK